MITNCTLIAKTKKIKLAYLETIFTTDYLKCTDMIPNPPNKNRFRKLVTEQPTHSSHSPSLLPEQHSQAEGALKQSLYSRKITRNTLRLQS